LEDEVVVTIQHSYELTHDLSNSGNFDDLGWPTASLFACDFCTAGSSYDEISTDTASLWQLSFVLCHCTRWGVRTLHSQLLYSQCKICLLIS